MNCNILQFPTTNKKKNSHKVIHVKKVEIINLFQRIKDLSFLHSEISGLITLSTISCNHKTMALPNFMPFPFFIQCDGKLSIQQGKI